MIELKETTDMPLEQLKPIHSLFDVVPVFNEELLRLGKWLAETTLCFMVSAFQAMLPAAMKAKYEKDIRLIEQHMPFIHEKYARCFATVSSFRGGKWHKRHTCRCCKKKSQEAIWKSFTELKKKENKNRKVGRTARKRR